MRVFQCDIEVACHTTYSGKECKTTPCLDKLLAEEDYMGKVGKMMADRVKGSCREKSSFKAQHEEPPGDATGMDQGEEKGRLSLLL